MTIKEAEQMIIDAYSNYRLPEENKVMLIEALEYLIEETHDPEHMMHLGGIYYDDRCFDLALKYYEMAAAYDHTQAQAVGHPQRAGQDRRCSRIADRCQRGPGTGSEV